MTWVLLLAKAYLILTTGILLAYVARHYVFTLARVFLPSREAYLEWSGMAKPTVTVLVPMHNEERVCGGILEALAQTSFDLERLQVIPINDRSTDRTGDIVVTDAAGDYLFVGRRDRMVKRRGNRVELNEVESGLYRHNGIQEAAVIATVEAEGGNRIKAFIVMKDGVSGGLIPLKRFCAEHLPASMAPDDFAFLSALPKTSTDKVDYQRLKDL